MTVTLKNVGEREGKEVVQLYLHDKVASVSRPDQELIAFKKVALGAGETKTLSFEITEPMLRFYNFKGEEVSEAGEFTLFVGYADHAKITKNFRLSDR